MREISQYDEKNDRNMRTGDVCVNLKVCCVYLIYGTIEVKWE